MTEKERFLNTGDEEGAGAGQPKEEKEWKVGDIKEIVSPDYLRAIAKAAGGFTFVIDQAMGPNDPAGKTNMETRVIHLNPYALREMPKEAIEGLLTHEAGHHAPEVVKLDQKMTSHLGKKDVLPQELAKDPQQEAEIIRAIDGHLGNTLSDCWLESFMSRRPHHLTSEKIEGLYQSIAKGRAKVDLTKFPKPEQLCQILVGEDRYPRPDKTIAELVDPDVYRVYLDLKRSGAIEAINSRRAWEDYFATDVQHEAALARKFFAFRDSFLPAWLELFQAESKERQKQMLSQGQGEGGQLTPEQIQQILNELAKELQKLGKKYGSRAPSKEEKEGLEQIVAKILKKEKGEEKPETKPEDNIGKDAQSLLRDWEDRRRRGLAENMGIRIESVKTWQDIKEEKKGEIETAAAQIADVFLEDRRKRLEYMRREGEIVPGLEYEYVAAVLSGDLAPQTHMKQVQNPEFLETEVEFVQDVSGSMSGQPIRKCLELQIILAEAFKKVKQSLADEQLLYPAEEDPLRIGVMKFETQAQQVKKLSEPMDDKAEMTIIDELTKGGGGTEEEEALKEVYGELTLHEKNILKIMVVLTDGHGNKEAVSRMMQQIEDDNEVIVAAVGLGSDAKAVVEAYTAGLRQGDLSNVHAFEKEDSKDLLPDLLEFFRVEIGKRRKYL